MPPLSQFLALGTGIGLAYFGPILTQLAVLRLQKLDLLLQTPEPPLPPPAWSCGPHAYTTELISLDPLVIYIHHLVSPQEADLIVQAGESALEPSRVTGGGGSTDARDGGRTSWSAPLPASDPAVECVLARAGDFLGTLLSPRRDDVGAAQMVHYTAGQRFDLHTDWFRQPRLLEADAEAGRRRLYNRAATFFVVLRDNCTEGETWFPQIEPAAPQDGMGNDGKGYAEGQVWRRHEDGGMAIRPVAGNALFWVNLMANGSGDPRVVHAGLPVGEGTKTAMNIWPRRFFGPDA